MATIIQAKVGDDSFTIIKSKDLSIPPIIFQDGNGKVMRDDLSRKLKLRKLQRLAVTWTTWKQTRDVEIVGDFASLVRICE